MTHNDLPGADKMKRATVRVDEQTLEGFDDVVADSEKWDNRSEAVRDLMAAVADGEEPDADGARVPPTDDKLADAWELLRTIGEAGTWVPEDRILGLLAQDHGMQKPVVRQALVTPLVKMGYIERMSPVNGGTSIKIR
jgi:Arc/MetJ-type ribon-helix-helix transcriptional regulator